VASIAIAGHETCGVYIAPGTEFRNQDSAFGRWDGRLRCLLAVRGNYGHRADGEIST
jgi:hypothetical protein